MRHILCGLIFFAIEVLDKYSQGIADSIGQTDISHIIASGKDAIFTDIA